MNRFAFVFLTLPLLSALTACGLGDSPEKAAQEWMQAFANLDGNKIAERTCAAQQANVQQAGMWASVFNIFGQQTIGQQGKTDISGLKFTTVSSSGNTANVRVTGQIRVAILALSQTQDVDETWRMAQEDGKWKWCGQMGALVPAPPTAPIARATSVLQDSTPYNGNKIEAKTLTGHKGEVSSVAFTPDGQMLATAGKDGTVKLWQVANGQLVRTIAAHQTTTMSVAISPDGKTLATSSWDNTAKLWRITDGQLLGTLVSHQKVINVVSFSPDGKTLATGSDDSTAKLWRVSDGQLLKTLTGESGRVCSVAFSPDGNMLATAGDDGIVRLWNPTDAQVLIALKDSRESEQDLIDSVAFSPDGKILATTSYFAKVKLWRVADRGLLTTITVRERRQDGYWDYGLAEFGVSFSRNGQFLATASGDGNVRLWRSSTGQLLTTLSGHEGAVFAVAFSPDGNTLATAGEDGTARLWAVGSLLK